MANRPQSVSQIQEVSFDFANHFLGLIVLWTVILFLSAPYSAFFIVIQVQNLSNANTINMKLFRKEKPSKIIIKIQNIRLLIPIKG